MFKLYAFLGGTFDPIHYGHLLPVEILAQQLNLHCITLLPNNLPPHKKKPLANSTQRIEMLRYAIVDHPIFRIDLREMNQNTPSWTIITLKKLRDEMGAKQPLGLIIGKDCLLTLTQWFCWEDLLSFCHLLIYRRPMYSQTMLTLNMQKWINKYRTDEIKNLYSKPSGFIWFAKNTPLLSISSMIIRKRYYHNLSCTGLLPIQVNNYIIINRLYTSSGKI